MGKAVAGDSHDCEQFRAEWIRNLPVYIVKMATNTLLCIHRDPAQLSLLEENGYELVTATNGHDGLRLFMSRPVDAIVLDYRLGLLDGGVVAAEMKKVKPHLPIVMFSESLELPVCALQSVDALVAKSDGLELLLATVQALLKAKPPPGGEKPLLFPPPKRRRRSDEPWDGRERRSPNRVQ